MIASGKSTLVEMLKTLVRLGIYINADDIESNLKKKPALHFTDYSIKTTKTSFIHFLKRKETLGSKEYKIKLIELIALEQNILTIPKEYVDSYLASIIADFLRHQLLKANLDFSFETVMSHPSKLNFLKTANKKEYRTYLYFVATNDPLINYRRIKGRVLKGGHDVSEQKLKERYKRSIALFKKAILYAYRCYVFDNTISLNLIAEYQQGKLKFAGEPQVCGMFQQKCDYISYRFLKPEACYHNSFILTFLK